MLNDISDFLAAWAIPLILIVVPGFGFLRKIKVYEAFVDGAAEGFHTSVRIMPFLVGMMVSISVFRASGALGALLEYIEPYLAGIGVEPELAPLALMRPLSGSGSLGLTTEILNSYGPDSLLGRTASTILGSTDTTFYVLTVYFGAVGITNPRYSVVVGLVGDIVGFFVSIYLCKIFFA